MDITKLLSFCKENNASDLHLSAGQPPIIRVYGKLRRIKADSLDTESIRKILYAVMSAEQRKVFEEEKDLDFAVSYGEKARFRVNTFTTRTGIAAVFRMIPVTIPTFDDLDLPPIFDEICSYESGLVLITGESGSGKSTTLAAMINHINQNRNLHVLTVEAPVEFIHESDKSLVNQREVGQHTESYERAITQALKEDPDVLVIDALSDYQTIALALKAAESGCLVLSTLSATSCIKTISRLIDVFPQQEKDMARTMLASALQGIITQKLFTKASGEGQIAAFEIMLATNAVRNLIRDNKLNQINAVIQTGARYGMISMEDAIKDLEEFDVI